MENKENEKIYPCAVRAASETIGKTGIIYEASDMARRIQSEIPLAEIEEALADAVDVLWLHGRDKIADKFETLIKKINS